MQVPEECPASIAALIKECMSGAPDKRPTAKEIFDRMQVLSNDRYDLQFHLH